MEVEAGRAERQGWCEGCGRGHDEAGHRKVMGRSWQVGNSKSFMSAGGEAR